MEEAAMYRLFRIVQCCFVLSLVALYVGCTDDTPTCSLVCNPGSYCYQNTCYAVCPEGQLSCDETCVDPLSDPKHCGACQNQCGDNQLCTNGRCLESCPAQASERCGLFCVNLQTNPRHCGVCGNTCKSDESCRNGQCFCAPGTAHCSGSCVSLSNDATHCGRCGNKCAAGEVCAKGRCIRDACPPETPDNCFGGCVDLASNRFHCGTCGSQCPKQQICEASTCTCPSGQSLCEKGACFDLQNEANHCGKCGNKCASGELCAGGRCVGQCPPASSTQCFGGCVDTKSNPLHCGGCGRRCPPGLACLESLCCLATNKICDGRCTDIQNDAANCGACGNACGSGGQCIRGRCCVDGCSFAQLFSGQGSSVLARAIGADRKGNLLVGGSYGGGVIAFGDKNVRGTPDIAMFVAKVSQAGDVQWVKVFGGAVGNRNTPRAITTDAQDFIYVTGVYTGRVVFGTITLNSVNNGQDIFVVKLRSDGAVMWARSIGGTGIDIPNAIDVTDEGILSLCGTTRSRTINNTNVTLYTIGLDNMLFAQLDAKGSLQWIKVGTSGQLAQCFGIAVDQAGGSYFVSAATNTKVDIAGQSITPKVQRSTVYGYIDPKGSAQWLRATSETQGSAIDIHEAKGATTVCIAGTVLQRTSFDAIQVSPAGFDGYVACMDKVGVTKWVKLIAGPGTSREFNKNISISESGTVHVTGLYENGAVILGGKTFKSNGGWDLYVVRYDLTGKLLSWIAFGGNGSDDVQGVAASPLDGSFIIGSTGSTNFLFNGKVLKPKAVPAAFVLYAAP